VAEAQPGSAGVAREAIDALMPGLRDDLATLVGIPSISGEGMPKEPIHAAHDLIAKLLRDAGIPNLGMLELPDTNPIVTAEIPAPDGAPTVLLYSHYDVVPAGEESEWDSPPFELTERDGGLYGRGSSDSKANVIAHIGALRAWEGRPPVGIKLVIEGEEEVGGAAFNAYPSTDPERFRADAMLIADMGSVRPGVPTVTIALRGMAMVTVAVETLSGPGHSGLYGGAAPDALLVVLHALASLHDEQGNVAVSGLRREEWTGASQSEEEFRELAQVVPGMPLIANGNLGSRVWSGPAITVTGIDVPSVEDAVNAVSAHARARINLRVHPEQGAEEAQAALVRHLESVRPFGITINVQAGATGNGFAADTSGPAYAAVRAAMSAAWDAETVAAASGGSIPVVNALHEAIPNAEVLLVGASDGFSNIHAPNERVLIDEFEKAIIAEADFFGRFADTHR
jgi:acetylornithine deacetylase/succinyl-diaminopimelate desuccinylase-like protein